MNHNHNHEKANEAERWNDCQCEEHRELLRDPIGKTSVLRQRESHSTVRNLLFGARPLSPHGRHASDVPSPVATDASSADESSDCWMGNTPGHSSSSYREIPSMPELSQMTPPPPSPSQPTIEISPGVHVRLRGADETWKAIENDYYMPAECACCESTIFCIQNADYVLCPDCRVVSRMEGISSHGIGGVGLGFKYEDLARWQDAILRDEGRPHVQFR
jgi:hypothetical protein